MPILVRKCIDRFSKACAQGESAINEVKTILVSARINLDDLLQLRCVLVADEEKRLGESKSNSPVRCTFKKLSISNISNVTCCILLSANSWRVQYVRLLSSLKDIK